ncbi:hypothetical protein P4J24_13775 [Bacillus anthracis]|nr:hypothetical protein [Bacillus anthracis]MEB9682977.1 hypothetical protein [Bacillus anthracis]
MRSENKKRALLSAILFILGLGVFLYPTVSNYLNHGMYKIVITDYEKQVGKSADADIRKKFQAMATYNESLKGLTFPTADPFTNSDNKNMTLVNMIKEDDVLGSISVPKIKEELPI